MEVIHVNTPSKQYPVYLGSGISSLIPQFLKDNNLVFSKILIVTDSKVADLYLQTLIKSLNSEFEVHSFIVDSGEKSKSIEVYYSCLTFALEKKLDRNSCLIALGGGVVGDLAGFVAATYMRGISFIQAPATILAHDSAVGGKVAINHELGKNMIGVFYQPEMVVYDTEFLKTLPRQEIRSGFAEIIKEAFIYDSVLLDWMIQEVKTISPVPENQLVHLLKRGIEIKAAIVSEDEREAGLRAILNFGHTLGHAVEAELGYGEITHGEAVLIGMLFALRVSEKFFGIDLESGLYQKWFEQLGYRTEIPEQLNPERLIERMKLDKKSSFGAIKMVLLKEIGLAEVHEVKESMLLSMLKK